MQTTVIRTDGTPVPAHHCVTPDHNLNTFVVTLRSLAGVSQETVKNLLQTRYEVVEIEPVNNVLVVKS